MKGLDLCLDAINTGAFPGMELHICGYQEPEFFSAYADIMSRPEVVWHGYVSLYSEEFRRIVERCSFVIFPGSSEAGCGSLLAAMRTGLIPIATKETTVDLEEFGIEIKCPTVAAIVEALNHAQRLSVDEVEARSKIASCYVRNHHTFDKYDVAIRRALSAVLEGVLR